jgi:hypothetical protein
LGERQTSAQNAAAVFDEPLNPVPELLPAEQQAIWAVIGV